MKKTGLIMLGAGTLLAYKLITESPMKRKINKAFENVKDKASDTIEDMM